MIKVKLNCTNYIPSPSNPVINTQYECFGELLYVVSSNLKYHKVDQMIVIDNLDPSFLTTYPMMIKWCNEIPNNISNYKLHDLLYYKDDEFIPKFKSIW